MHVWQRIVAVGVGRNRYARLPHCSLCRVTPAALDGGPGGLALIDRGRGQGVRASRDRAKTFLGGPDLKAGIGLGLPGAHRPYDVRSAHVEVATGLTGAFQLTPKLEGFVEWDAFYPVEVTDPSTGPRHFGVGGFVYFITRNFAVDIRAGVGLNDRANDFLAGVGFAVRF